MNGSRRQQENHWVVVQALASRPIRLMRLSILGIELEYRGRLRFEAEALSSWKQTYDIPSPADYLRMPRGFPVTVFTMDCLW